MATTLGITKSYILEICRVVEITIRGGTRRTDCSIHAKEDPKYRRERKNGERHMRRTRLRAIETSTRLSYNVPQGGYNFIEANHSSQKVVGQRQ